MSLHDQKPKLTWSCEQCRVGNCDLCIDSVRVYTDAVLCNCRHMTHRTDLERGRAFHVAALKRHPSYRKLRSANLARTAGCHEGEF